MREIEYKRILYSVTLLLILGSQFLAPNIFAQRRTIASGAWSDTLIWQDNLIPKVGDTVIISQQDSVFLDTSTVPLAKLFVDGKLAADTNIIFLAGDSLAIDTSITIRGTLDAGTGWIVVNDTLSKRPIIRIDSGGHFHTKSLLPSASASIFDSLRTPSFSCDLQSTFEYYSENTDLIDVSYLANNLIGRAYGNLTLTNINASFRSNPVGINGMLRIGFGSSVIASARVSGVKGYDPQVITISGDVVNENLGESGSAGAGLRGCGMQSLGNDKWIFDGALNPGFVSNWTGPSQLGTLIVKQNATLRVRFLSDTACDSLDVITGLIEEGMPCGGHLIGRIFSEFPRQLDASNPIDSMYGFGLTIRTGTNPYLGRTRIVRTSGYLPPGANAENHSVLRYYQITPGDGPQQGDTNEITFQFHCSELNGANLNDLHFWRSRNRGASWAYSGRTSFNPTSLAFVWDTTCLGFPNDSGGFYWMLSGGYTDSPNPIELQSFVALRETHGVRINWQTASEVNTLGYELRRRGADTSKLVASYLGDSSLLSRSQYGAAYGCFDDKPDSANAIYELYEVTEDGVQVLLGSKSVDALQVVQTPSTNTIEYSEGMLRVSLHGGASTQARLILTDAIGRSIINLGFENQFACNPQIRPGVYWVRVEWNGGAMSRKILVGEVSP